MEEMAADSIPQLSATLATPIENSLCTRGTCGGTADGLAGGL